MKDLGLSELSDSPNAATPFHRKISIVMPVFNTGRLLLGSVRSVVGQTLFVDNPDASWELLIVNDASDDPETVAALDEARTFSSHVRVIPNSRQRGAAGARNCGILASQAQWICFLDSDDVWYSDFLQQQFRAFADIPEARWRSSHFQVGDPDEPVDPVPLQKRSPILFSHIAEDYQAGRVSRLRDPVKVLLSGGCMGILTVQIDRLLLLSVGGFNESYPCAEDYDLWLRLAAVEAWHIAPIDAGVYRLRPGSLTRSGRPMYFFEDKMLTSLRRDRAFRRFRRDLDHRLEKVYSTFCFHYREHRQFRHAAEYALKLLKTRPSSVTGWRHLAATALKR